MSELVNPKLFKKKKSIYFIITGCELIHVNTWRKKKVVVYRHYVHLCLLDKVVFIYLYIIYLLVYLLNVFI